MVHLLLRTMFLWSDQNKVKIEIKLKLILDCFIFILCGRYHLMSFTNVLEGGNIIFYYFYIQLPPEMGLLRKLWNLDLSGNPVERLLLSLLGEKAKKTAAVLGYLKSIKDE